MGRLLKLFQDGAVKKCTGAVRGYTAEGSDDRFCLRIEGPRSLGFEGYVMRLTESEARKLKPRLDEYVSPITGWKPMTTAPKDREILARRHNDVVFEHCVVWWNRDDAEYPWRSQYTAYPEGRLDEWHEIP